MYAYYPDWIVSATGCSVRTSKRTAASFPRLGRWLSIPAVRVNTATLSDRVATEVGNASSTACVDAADSAESKATVSHIDTVSPDRFLFSKVTSRSCRVCTLYGITLVAPLMGVSLISSDLPLPALVVGAGALCEPHLPVMDDRNAAQSGILRTHSTHVFGVIPSCLGVTIAPLDAR